MKCHQANRKHHTGEKFWLEMVTIVCLIQSSVKFMQLIRYNEAFCFLVEMLTQVFKDIYPFLIVFFTFNVLFVFVTYILEGGYGDDNYPYMGVFPILINNLQTFRNSIGDLAEPEYGAWIPEDTKVVDGHLQNNYQYAVIGVTWFFFVANIFIMQIVLLNFLVAEVSMTYARIKDLGPCLIYQKKQELNFFVQKILVVYQKQNPFKALIFINPKDMGEEDDDYADLRDGVKDTISYEIFKVAEELVPNQKKIHEMSTINMNCITDVDEKISKLQDKIGELLLVQQQLGGDLVQDQPIQQESASAPSRRGTRQSLLGGASPSQSELRRRQAGRRR